MRPLHFRWQLLPAALLLSFYGCQKPSSPNASSTAFELAAQSIADQRTEAWKNEKPWEVNGLSGETLLPDVFYADDVQNEQVMPLLNEAGRPQIQRLIYPTLGHPALATRSAPEGLTLVMRLEPEALAHLSPEFGEAWPGTALRTLILKSVAGNELAFWAIPRNQRAQQSDSAAPVAEGRGAVRLRPSMLLVNPISSDMPAELSRKLTVRAVFSAEDLQKLPSGLFDVRIESLKGGALAKDARGQGIYEFQYNSLKMFDTPPQSDSYRIINITDTQSSVGKVIYKKMTTDHLYEFVSYANGQKDKDLKDIAFVTFNGDLHNGGSPGTIISRSVAKTYSDESVQVVNALKELQYPIFLTPGNHDGYTSSGHAPSGVYWLEGFWYPHIEKVVSETNPKPWENFRYQDWENYISRTENNLEGFHKDVVTGRFVRRNGTNYGNSFQRIPQNERNMVLYDGFHQWQKFYGPLYYSWKFGKNHYISLNTYDLRQHQRMGWGMYVTNYGGGISDFQMDWLRRELAKPQNTSSDIVLIAHHDPRGGHDMKNYPHQFQQLPYSGMSQVAWDFIVTNVFNPAVCALPQWMMDDAQRARCRDDGLQEWMAPDAEFDCAPALKTGGKCAAQAEAFNSGHQLIDLLSRDSRIRTFVIGHTHKNSWEVKQSGEEWVPASHEEMGLDESGMDKRAALDTQDPLRQVAWEKLRLESAKPGLGLDGSHLPSALSLFTEAIAKAASIDPRISRVLSGQNRELFIARFMSNADLSSTKYQGKSLYGFQVLDIRPRSDTRKMVHPQINGVTFYRNDAVDGASGFRPVVHLDVDRTIRMGTFDGNNPLNPYFQ